MEGESAEFMDTNIRSRWRKEKMILYKFLISNFFDLVNFNFKYNFLNKFLSKFLILTPPISEFFLEILI